MPQKGAKSTKIKFQWVTTGSQSATVAKKIRDFL